MRIAGLDESQAGTKTAGRNTNNLRYVYTYVHIYDMYTYVYVLPL